MALLGPSFETLPTFFEPAHVELGQELASRLAEDDAALHDPAAVAARLGALGLTSLVVPASLGGRRLGGSPAHVGVRGLCVAREALGYVSPLADSVLAVMGLGAHPFVLAAGAARREAFLAEVARGARVPAFALTEPEAGSDVGAIRTRAVRDGAGWVLDGEKVFISNAGIATDYAVFAQTDPALGRKGLACFRVPAGAPGFEVTPLPLSVPHPLGRLGFQGCRVPGDALVGAVGDGLKLALGTLDVFRTSVAAAAVGMARRALDEALGRVRTRVQFGRPLVEQQLVKAHLADMLADVESSRLLVARAAWEKDRAPGDRAAAPHVALAKLHATEAAQRVIDRAVQLFGGLGVVDGTVVERLYREIRPLRIYEGTSEIQKLILGDALAAGLAVRAKLPVVPHASPGGALFAPLRLPGGVELPNRLVLPAMVTRLSGEDGHVNDDVRARYVRFAKGGVGLVVLEAMAVHGAKSGPLLRLHDDAFVPGLRELVRALHGAGPGKVFPQILHFLKVSRSGWRQTIDTLVEADLDAIVEAYGRAAVRAREAGTDGVELHMAHAYTLSSFLSRLNPRRDAYGGSLANRLRLPLRVLARVRALVGDDFPVGVRFVGDECVRGGYTPLDAGLLAVELARAGAAYVSLSVGGKFEDARVVPGAPPYPYTGYSGDRCMPPASYPDGANLYVADAVKRALVAAGLATPVVAAGKIGARDVAEGVLARGTADLVGLARALLADPDLPRKWAEDGDARVVRCVYGNVCKALDESFRRVDCTLWPKGLGQAPEPPPRAPHAPAPSPPSWPAGAALRASCTDGRVLLRFPRAEAPGGLYGYEVLRADGEGAELVHYASVRARSERFEDARIVAGGRYGYALRPYDLGGRRGPATATAWLDVPADHVPAGDGALGPAADAAACVAGVRG